MDLQALVVTNGLNTIYVTGILTRIPFPNWERPGATVIPLDGEPFTIQNEILIPCIRLALERGRAWIKDVRYWQEHVKQGTNRLHTKHEVGLMLSDGLRERGIIKGRIGVDAGAVVLHNLIGPYLPDLKCVNASNILREMRLIKCEEELNLIRNAAELTDWGQNKYFELASVGKRIYAHDTEVTHLIAVEATEKYPDYLINIRSHAQDGGPYSAGGGYGGYRGYKIQKGDSIIYNCILSLNGYHSENERTMFIGEPTKKQRKAFEVMVEAHEKGIAMCVEGNKVSDIEAAAQGVIEKAGFGEYMTHRVGHGMGLSGHENWLNAGYNHMKMKAGMVCSVEPGFYFYLDSGYRHSDTVVVGKNEPEVVTKSTKDPDELIKKV